MMIVFVLTTVVLSAESDTIFLEYGGKSKTCLSSETACHSLDLAVNTANWTTVTMILIKGHAKLIGEVVFDSNADKFKKGEDEDVQIIMGLVNGDLGSDHEYVGLTGHGTIVIKGTKSAEMRLGLVSREDNFIVSTSRTPGGTKKGYVFRVEKYGVLDLHCNLIVRPLQAPPTTPFTKLTSKFETTFWDQESAAIVVEKGALTMYEDDQSDFHQDVIVEDPELGVLILDDIDTEKSQISISQRYAYSQTSLHPKGIVCSLQKRGTGPFNITIHDSGKRFYDADDDLVGIEQFPLLFISDNCNPYDYEDKDKKFLLGTISYLTMNSSAFVFPKARLSRSNLKMSTKSSGASDVLGNNLLATFTSSSNLLIAKMLTRLKVSIAPRYHTEEVDDKLIRWNEMAWYIGTMETELKEGGVTITQSGQSNLAVAAIPLSTVGKSGEYTVKMEFDDEVKFVDCLYSGARSALAFTTFALLLAVLLGF
ncbi:hypothetical protein BLNAU_5199 [Blattamonas nauphoetae]|uniref:Uncharacterized protein n=1 Tax=Blattamonas nauphoetae TaxID=2049346 RepID=A0ABQ9Y7G8_9EUKA|nr:hypothetical protein BLNAU_5199 [Blattamonas nauphoetae]